MQAQKTILVGGAWQASHSRREVELISPTDGCAFTSLSAGDGVDVDLAVHAAEHAMGPWGLTPSFERGRVLHRISGLILQHELALADLESRATGNPSGQALADVRAAARYFEYYGGAADKIVGDVVPYFNGFQVSVLREPHGIVGLMIPWNSPASTFGKAIAPALATGNVVILKPADHASVTATKLAELSQAAGIPKGVLNLVTGADEEAGVALASHPKINLISFTGSPQCGAMIQSAAARSRVPCVIEPGGESFQVVFQDADLGTAANAIISGITQNTGQMCSVGSRVLVQRTIYPRLATVLAELTSRVTAGAPRANLHCGPVISRSQFERVTGIISRAERRGVLKLAQGKIDISAHPSGFFVRPAIFGPVPVDHELAQEEVLGPVLALIPFDDEVDAIRILHRSQYPIVVGLWTENGARQLRIAKRVRACRVLINNHGSESIELPFVESQRVDHECENGLEVFRQYTTTKTVVHRYT